MLLAATASDHAALAFIEIGAVALALSVLARLASRLGVTAIPLYLLAGLAVGKGGVAPLDVSADFIQLAGEIGVLLLLLTLGLEYAPDELRQGLRTGAVPGIVDAAVNFAPGFLAGVVLGWEPADAVLLGGVCWVSSSGVVAKVLADLGRLGDPETGGVLNLLVIEDLAMAVYLPVAGALVAGTGAGDTVLTFGIAGKLISGWVAARHPPPTRPDGHESVPHSSRAASSRSSSPRLAQPPTAPDSARSPRLTCSSPPSSDRWPPNTPTASPPWSRVPSSAAGLSSS